MDDWQRQHVHRNLEILVSKTNCNAHFLSQLAGYLSEDDDALLVRQKTFQLLLLKPEQ